MRLRSGTRTEEHTRREVLDLALAIDGWVRHDRDGLVEMVREVRARGARGERAVVSERPDWLVARLDREGGHPPVVRLAPERRALAPAACRPVLARGGRRRER